jgi:hypothetical protein
LQFTCLPYKGNAGVVEANMRVVGSLTSLEKLWLFGRLTQPISRRACIAALGKLPLLEDVPWCFAGNWSRAELLRLLPPPARLKRISLHQDDTLGWCRWGPAVVTKFASYGVDLAVA